MDVTAESSSSSKEFSCQIPDKMEERPSSPMDCAICLEQLTDKSFTNSCLHMFCFHCLLAWSKIKPECPLCKQDFCSIIHNIRSMTDYDEYHVPPPEARLSVFVNPEITPNPIFARDPHDFFSNQRSFFSYRTTITSMSGGYRLPRVDRPNNLLIQPYIDNLEIQADFSRLNPNPAAYSRCNRREIYVKELETLPPPSGGRYRECAPNFYRENESQIHRLVRWLQRELSALSQVTNRFSTQELLRVIMDMLTIYHINSTTFFNTVNRYLGAHTARFVREFHRFATSPFEMEQYDRECLFVRQRTGSQLSFIVTVGRDDSEDVQVCTCVQCGHVLDSVSTRDHSYVCSICLQIIPNASNHAFRPWIDVNDLGRAHSSTSTSDAIPQTSSSRNSSTGLFSNRQRSHSIPFVPETIINISDSENDDCVIIDQVRSGHETIILDDSNDEQSSVIKVSAAANSHDLPKPRPEIDCIPSTSYQSVGSVNLTSTANSCLDRVTTVKNENDNEVRIKNLSSTATAREKDHSSHDSSILSTDASSNENHIDKRSLYRKCKRKRSKKYYRSKDMKRKQISLNYNICESSGESIVLTESSAVETDKDDLDWEKSHEGRRKTKKINTFRHLPLKKRKHHIMTEETGVMTNHGIEILNTSNESHENAVDSEVRVFETHYNGNPCRLRSVVRKVENRPSMRRQTERNYSYRTRKVNNSDNVCSCSDLSQLRNEPCTSHGIYNRHREACRFYSIMPVSRNVYSSDSD